MEGASERPLTLLTERLQGSDGRRLWANYILTQDSPSLLNETSRKHVKNRNISDNDLFRDQFLHYINHTELSCKNKS
jgi:hypothetical protein